MSSRAGATVAGFVVALLAGCGVPAQDEPHGVDLPRSPLVASTQSAPPPSAVGEVAEVLCLAHDGRLAQTVRRVAAPPTVRQQLDDLVTGPTPTEQAMGLTTALASLSLTAQPPSDGQIVVEITEPDDGAARSDEILAYGQLVCTLTARPDVNSVIFTRGGRRLEVPRADGTLTREPLRGGDYSSLIGPA